MSKKSSFSLDLGGMKKVKSDKHYTTLRHPSGHEITLAHSALSSYNKRQLEALPHYAEGGQVNKPNPSSSPPAPNKKDAEAFVKGFNKPDNDPGVWIKNLKSGLGFADGGQVDEHPIEIEEVLPGEVAGKKNKGDIKIEAVPEGKKAHALSGNIQVEKLADGGEVTPVNLEASSLPASLINQSPASATPVVTQMTPEQAAASNPGALPYGITPDMVAANPQQAAMQPMAGSLTAGAPSQAPASSQPAGGGMSSAPQAPSDPYGARTQESAFLQGLGEERAGILGGAKAQSDLGAKQAQALQKSANDLADLTKHYQEKSANLQATIGEVAQDLQSGHIDPNRYLGNMSTGQRIGTAIGLIISGIGAGIGHTRNMAADFIENQINRDIDAQKAELNKKHTLLSALMAQGHDQREALGMTKALMLDQTRMMLEKAAAQSQDPMAKARALQEAGKLGQQTAQMVGSLAMRSTMLAGANSGKIDPEKFVTFVVPEHERPEAIKELNEAKSMVAFKDNALSAFDKLTGINTLGHAITSPIQTSAQKDALVKPLVAVLGKELAGRFTEADAKFFESMLPAKTDNQESLAIKRNQLKNFIDQKMNFGKLEGYGLNPKSWGRYDAQGASNIQEKPVK